MTVTIGRREMLTALGAAVFGAPDLRRVFCWLSKGL
jgi:hypothetical protein